MSNFIKYCKIFDVILTSFQQKEKNPAIEELHLFSNHVITRWKIKIFFSVISISSNCNFTSNTKHKCTTDLFAEFASQGCQSSNLPTLSASSSSSVGYFLSQQRNAMLWTSFGNYFSKECCS